VTPTRSPTPTPTGTPTPAPTSTPPSTPTATASPASRQYELVTFDDLPGQNQPLNGQYPAGVIDWGSGQWFHSGPTGQFTTKSVSFSGPGATSATFTFLTPRRLVRLDAYNGGIHSTFVTLRCPGHRDVRRLLAPAQMARIWTGWRGPCASVTLSSTNGWATNFDTLVLFGN
jgi:hypothetical protein